MKTQWEKAQQDLVEACVSAFVKSSFSESVDPKRGTQWYIGIWCLCLTSKGKWQMATG